MKRVAALFLAAALVLLTAVSLPACSSGMPGSAETAGPKPALPDTQALFYAAVQMNIDDCSVDIDAGNGAVYGVEQTTAVAGGSAVAAAAAGCLLYQWQREPEGGDEAGWADIPGATGVSYTPAAEDVGRLLRVVIRAKGDFGGSVASGAIGPVQREPYGGEEPARPVSASPTDLTITVKTERNQEYVIIPYGDGGEPEAPGETQWDRAYEGSASGSGWRRFKGLMADTRYAIWTRVPGSGTMEPSAPMYSEFSTTATYVSGSAASWANPFSDVPAGGWYYGAVKFVCANKLMQGLEQNVFGPEETTTRAMVITVLWRMEDEPDYGPAVFPDVSPGSWCAAAVAWAEASGIVEGYDDGTFKPNAAVTREQLAAMLGRYAAYRGFDMSLSEDLSAYPDGGDIQHFAAVYMQWAVGSGLIAGTEDGSLRPRGHATRAEFAAMLMRLLGDG